MDENRNSVAVSLFAVFLIFTAITFLSYGANTPRLSIPEMVEAEAQPHLTFNELAWKMDALTFPTLTAYPAAADPVSNATDNGSLYVIPVDASGEWTGKDEQLAFRLNDIWYYLIPQAGWEVNKPDNGGRLYFNGWIWLTAEFQADTVIDGTGISGDVLKIISDKSNPSWPIGVMDKDGLQYMFFLGRNDSPNDNYLYLTLGSGTLPPTVKVKVNAAGDSYFNGGNTAFGHSSPDSIVDLLGGLTIRTVADPPDPDEGAAVLWLDSSGNLKIKSNVGGTVHSGNVFTY